MRFLEFAPLSRHFGLILAGLLGAAACSLTEAVRTMPGAPGEVGFGNGGSPAFDAGAGGSSVDGGGDARSDGSPASGGAGGGKGGTSGRPDADAPDGFDPAPPVDARVDGAPECPVDITFACHDYCGALSLPLECRERLIDFSGAKSDGSVHLPDGSLPHDPTTAELVNKCTCACELRYRSGCGFEFDQLIMCGEPPLTVVCPADPTVVFPSIIGPCGGARSRFVQCLSTSIPPDASP